MEGGCPAFPHATAAARRHDVRARKRDAFGWPWARSDDGRNQQPAVSGHRIVAHPRSCASCDPDAGKRGPEAVRKGESSSARRASASSGLGANVVLCELGDVPTVDIADWQAVFDGVTESEFVESGLEPEPIRRWS